MKPFCIVAILLSNIVSAQTTDRLTSNLPPNSSPENLFLHVNKTILLAGDSVFFKSYIFQNDHLSNLSTTLYVDLLDKRGYLIDYKTFPIIAGLSVGQIAIPSHLSAGIYYMRAYTKWQLNFADGKLFQIPISVMDTPSDNYIQFKHNSNAVYHYWIDSMIILATFTPGGLFINCTPEAGSRYVNSTIQVYFISPKITGKGNWKLEADSTKSLLFPVKDDMGDVDVVIVDQSNEVILQEKLIRPPKLLQVTITADTLDCSAKALNVWNLQLKDSNIATLSISITDADMDSSYLPVQQIFSTTHFPYKKVIKGEKLSTHLVDSSYICLQGRAFKLSDKNVIKNKSLLAFITTSDSGKAFQEIPVDTGGYFALRNLFYYDTATIYFQLKDKERRSKDIVLKFDRFFRPAFICDSNLYTFNVHTGLQKTPFLEVTKRKDNLFGYDKIGTMKEVIVRAKKKTVTEKMDEEYARGAFRGGINSKGFDLINDHTALGAGNVLEYLSMRMPGLQVSKDATTGKINGVNHRQESMLFFLNEMPCDVEQVLNMSMFQIAYVKIHPAPFVGGFLMKGAIAVYTKNGSDLEIPEPRDLAPVVVTARNMHRTLDRDYTSGIFTKRADFAVDLRNSQKEFDLLRYLSDKIPGFTYTEMGPGLHVSYYNKPIKIFVDEWSIMPGQLNLYRYNVNFLAYAKVISTFPDQGSFTNALALYTRQGADINGISAGLNKEKLFGYDKIRYPMEMDYSKPSDYADNRINLYWNPLQGSGSIRFYNNDYTKRFRVVLQGVSTTGRLLYYETIIDQNYKQQKK